MPSIPPPIPCDFCGRTPIARIIDPPAPGLPAPGWRQGLALGAYCEACLVAAAGIADTYCPDRAALDAWFAGPRGARTDFWINPSPEPAPCGYCGNVGWALWAFESIGRAFMPVCLDCERQIRRKARLMPMTPKAPTWERVNA